MPRTSSWHSPEPEYHHSNSECLFGELIPPEKRIPGYGGKPLCPVCERLNRAEIELEPR